MKHRNNLKRFLYLDFYYSVLRRDWRISTFLSDLVLKTVAVVIVSIDRFIKDASMISASALTFYSTLSFIPVVALILLSPVDSVLQRHSKIGSKSNLIPIPM